MLKFCVIFLVIFVVWPSQASESDLIKLPLPLPPDPLILTIPPACEVDGEVRAEGDVWQKPIGSSEWGCKLECSCCEGREHCALCLPPPFLDENPGCYYIPDNSKPSPPAPCAGRGSYGPPPMLLGLTPPCCPTKDTASRICRTDASFDPEKYAQYLLFWMAPDSAAEMPDSSDPNYLQELEAHFWNQVGPEGPKGPLGPEKPKGPWKETDDA
ncbi:PREDICTED: uncharacterized protein LOC106809474 [Priapulus caudatus]|uniref:Uncharacterized protein LOC106809474 n=1 Tax=Priapulus caudatus TaxID=37621 RepID=A0ABM1E777_PRICU|nr:PREDICTED: uncharacterized protein LOC106809474 [Priapulus caudatus]